MYFDQKGVGWSFSLYEQYIVNTSALNLLKCYF